MISTTTMMMSSPALSWVAGPTSSIITSSEGVNMQHVYLTISGTLSALATNVEFCNSDQIDLKFGYFTLYSQ